MYPDREIYHEQGAEQWALTLVGLCSSEMSDVCLSARAGI